MLDSKHAVMTAIGTTARLHALVSAGIENPALIARWRADPELLRGHGIEPSMVDLESLWRFAGLTVKVRHHALRSRSAQSAHRVGIEPERIADRGGAIEVSIGSIDSDVDAPRTRSRAAISATNVFGA